MAERQGFEPWEGFPSTVFKTAAFDHSATSPKLLTVYCYSISVFLPPRGSFRHFMSTIPGRHPFGAISAIASMFKFVPDEFVDHSATSPKLLTMYCYSISVFSLPRGGSRHFASHIHVLRPSGRLAAVQFCSGQNCRPLSHLS